LRRRLSVASTAAFVCALTAAGCGSSSGSSNSANPVVSGDPVAQAAVASAGAPGYKMSMTMKMSGASLPTTMNVTGQGSFDTRDHSGTFSIDLPLGSIPGGAAAFGGNTLHMNEVIKGLTVYVQLPAALASKLPGGKQWMKIDLSQAASAAGIPGLGSLASNPASSDPSQLLQYLRAAGSVKSIGSETVNGVSTTHYSATINLDKVPSSIPSASQQSSARQAIAGLEKVTGLHSIPVEVWIDSSHQVRRLNMAFTENLPTGTSIHLQMVEDITGYGPQPQAQPPSADQVLDATALISAATKAASGH
jgi:hypothetical protein